MTKNNNYIKFDKKIEQRRNFDFLTNIVLKFP